MQLIYKLLEPVIFAFNGIKLSGEHKIRILLSLCLLFWFSHPTEQRKKLNHTDYLSNIYYIVIYIYIN